MHLEAARERRVRRLVAARAEHAPPAERVDDERRATGRRGRCATVTSPSAARARRTVAVSNSASFWASSSCAELRVVEGREGPRAAGSATVVWGVWTTSSPKRLADRAPQAERLEPLRRARRRPRSGARRPRSGRAPARARAPPARRPARGRRRARRSSLRRSRRRIRRSAECARRLAWCAARHRARRLPAAIRRQRRGRCRYSSPRAAGRHAPPEAGDRRWPAPTDLMIEVDGQLVPNYDATIVSFEEGDVVTGKVVRIDKDEVLVDIGYKSEGVIPSDELSIRRSIDPADEVAARRGGRRARPHQGGPGRPPDPVEEARPLRARLAPDRGRRRVRRAGRGHRDRGRQGRPDHRPRRARLPARVAGRHPPRAEPRRVPRPEDRVQGDRAQPQPQQRRALAARGARGGAQGGPPADPRPAPARRGRGGHDLEHRRLRRVRGPRRDRRPDPHLRAFLGPRQPPVRGALDRRHRAR